MCDNITNINAVCSQSSRVFTLTVQNPPNHSDTQDISLKISNLINPLSVLQSSIFLIQITDGSDKLIENSTTIPKVRAVAASITDINIIPSSLVTTTQNVTYDFEFRTSGLLLQNGFNLEVQIPPQIDFTNQSNSLASCAAVEIFSSITCSIVEGSSGKKFSANIILSSDYPGGSSASLLKFRMGSYTNPRSLKPVTFRLKITKIGSLSYTGQKAIQMTTPINFASVSISSNSPINGNLSEYTFVVNSSTLTKSGDYYQIQLPQAMQLNSSPACSDSLNNNLSCSATSSQQINIQINTQISQSTPFTFRITSIYNPASNKSQDIIVSQTEFINGSFFQISSSTVTNSYTSNYATIPNITVQPSNSQISQTSDYTFNIEAPITFIPSGTKITIQFPTQFPQLQSSITCKSTALIDASLTCSKTSPRQIEITNGFPAYTNTATNNRIIFTINSITNGNTSVQRTSNFSVDLKISSNQIISQFTSNLSTTFTCDSNCLTCENQPNECLACKSQPDSSFIYHHLTADKICYQSCPAGFYDNNITPPICSPCNAPCVNCDTGPDSCTLCDTTNITHRYLNINTCIQNCPDGKFVRSNICQECNAKCQTCHTNESNCTSCKALGQFSFFYQAQNDCLSACPDGFVGIGNNCQQCSSPCASCTGITTQCLSCQSNQLLYSNTCVDSCPTDFVVNEDGNKCIKFEPKRDEVLYFIFLALFVFILIILSIIKAVMNYIRFLKSLIALQSFVQVLSWAFLIWFLIRDNHLVSTTIVGVAIFFHYLANLILFLFTKRLRRKDAQFAIHFQKYKCAHTTIIIFSIIFSHKFYRFVVSFFFHQKKLNAKFQQRVRFTKILTYLTVMSMFFTSLPIMFACGFNIFFNTALLQLFYTDIEVFAITLIIVILEVIQACKDQKRMKQVVEREKKSGKYRLNKASALSRSDIHVLTEDNTINQLPIRKLTVEIDEVISINGQEVSKIQAERVVRSDGYKNAIYDDNNSVNNITKSKRHQNNNYTVVERRRSFPLTPKTQKLVQEQMQKQIRNSGITVATGIGANLNNIQNNYNNNKNNNNNQNNSQIKQEQFSFDDNQGQITSNSIYPYHIQNTNYQSFTQKRPGKIRQTMPINVAPNRLNAAETQGPDLDDLKYQIPDDSISQDLADQNIFENLRKGIVPRFVSEQKINNYNKLSSKSSNTYSYIQNMERNKNYQSNQRNNEERMNLSRGELQAAGAVPKIQFSNQSVDYISDIELDINDKSTDRQLMDDISDF